MKVLVENSGIQLAIEFLNESIESSISIKQINHIAETAIQELLKIVNGRKSESIVYNFFKNNEVNESDEINEINEIDEVDEINEINEIDEVNENDEESEESKSEESKSEDDDDDDELCTEDVIYLENKNEEWENNCVVIKESIMNQDKDKLKEIMTQINDINTPIIINGLKKNEREWSFKFFKSLNKDSINVTTWSMKVNKKRIFYIKLD